MTTKDVINHCYSPSIVMESIVAESKKEITENKINLLIGIAKRNT